MRPLNSGASPTSGLRLWKSPIPYLFGGLALMLTLIFLALVILICSYYRKLASSHASPEDEEDAERAIPMDLEIDSEPKVLVIMAGDDKPTYLAKPITPLTYCTCEAEAEPTLSSNSSTEQRSVAH